MGKKMTGEEMKKEGEDTDKDLSQDPEDQEDQDRDQGQGLQVTDLATPQRDKETCQGHPPSKASKVHPYTKTMLFYPKCAIFEHTSMFKKLEFSRIYLDFNEIYRFS